MSGMRAVRRNFSGLERRRMEAAGLLREGVRQAEVARRLGVRRQSVNEWAKKIRRGGVWALKAGQLGYLPLKSKGYEHEVTFLKRKKKTPSELMPRVHQVISLLKRWLMGTH